MWGRGRWCQTCRGRKRKAEVGGGNKWRWNPHALSSTPPPINPDAGLWTADTDTCLIKTLALTCSNPDLSFIAALTGSCNAWCNLIWWGSNMDDLPPPSSLTLAGAPFTGKEKNNRRLHVKPACVARRPIHRTQRRYLWLPETLCA